MKTNRNIIYPPRVLPFSDDRYYGHGLLHSELKSSLIELEKSLIQFNSSLIELESSPIESESSLIKLNILKWI